MNGKRIWITDELMHELIREERKYNECLRERRAATIGSRNKQFMISIYDQQISESDKRMLILYEKNR